MINWWKFGLGFVLLGILALGMGAERQVSATATYNNDFVLDSERLEQGERSNTSESTDTSDLFNQELNDKINAYEKGQLEENTQELDSLFLEEAVEPEDSGTDELFTSSESDSTISYATKTQTEEDTQDYSLLFYLLLGGVLIAGFVYVIYIFLRGEG